MNKHTPGPWFVEETSSGWIVTFGDDGEQIVDFVYEEADAHLIAAAPVLLAACKKAREFMRTIAANIDDMDALDAAITAAEGAQ